MTAVTSRELRNHTAEVLRQVADGARITVTVNGTPVAEIGPVIARRPQFFEKADLMRILREHQADAGLTGDLERLAGKASDHPELL